MLIKKPDDQSAHLAELEARAQGRSAEAKRAEVELCNRRAGIRGEEQAALTATRIFLLPLALLQASVIIASYVLLRRGRREAMDVTQ